MDKCVYLVLLEFPEEKVNDPNLKWMESNKQEIEQFCKEYCYKVGTFHILPEPYLRTYCCSIGCSVIIFKGHS